MKDKIVLIQNVATLRGTTVQDFEGMNELKEKFPDLEILAFPCNQFGHQCNEGADEIKNMLKYVRPGNGFEFKGKLQKGLRERFESRSIVQVLEIGMSGPSRQRKGQQAERSRRFKRSCSPSWRV